MAIRVTTKSGRQYVIDDGLWRRLPKFPGEYTMGWESVWRLEHGTVMAHPWDAPEGTWEPGDPVVGEFMHIGSRDMWWTSTEVVSVEEIPTLREEAD